MNATTEQPLQPVDDVAQTAVLVDAYPLWLEAVERVLDGLGVVTVAKATSPTEAFELVRTCQPRVVVTDVDFGPGEVGGSAYIERLLDLCPGLSVIVLAPLEELARVAEVIDAGAAAYAIKSIRPDDLAAAIRQCFEQSVFFAPAAGTRPLPEHARGGPQMPAHTRTRPVKVVSDIGDPPLTRRELEILTLVSEGLHNADIARKLWITDQTVKFHLTNIYRKLGVSNRTQASRWATAGGSNADDPPPRL
jgi:two-component system, NarL family, response regulator DegU